MNQQSNAKPTVAILLMLFVFALGGFIGCIAFGLQDVGYNVRETPQYGANYTVIADTGLNGGALGCGIFGAAALFAFVKVYLAKTN